MKQALGITMVLIGAFVFGIVAVEQAFVLNINGVFNAIIAIILCWGGLKMMEG